MKVILSLHNANLLGKSASDDFCDAYCHYLHDNGIEWHSFYTNGEMRTRLKERYSQVLTSYKSPNFGKTWNQLSEVILAIDLQNEPMVGDSNMEHDFGDWVCDMARHLKTTCGLSGIAVATGGLRGADWGDAPPATVGQNWPNDVFECDAVNIIAFHGYYTDDGKAWLNLFSEEDIGGILRPKALQHNKLLMVEEWSYSRGRDDNFVNQKGDIEAQGKALNLRGIPWLYWDIMSGADGWCDADGCKEVSIDGNGPWPALASVMKEPDGSSTEFDWSKYFPNNPSTGAPSDPAPATPAPENPDCTWGCLGWDCSVTSPCSEGRQCVSGICRASLKPRASKPDAECDWGCEGWNCDAKTPCSEGRQCDKGICHMSKSSSEDKSDGSCTWGCNGWDCSADSPCADNLHCVRGICKLQGSDEAPPSQSSKTENTPPTSTVSPDECTWGCEGWDCNSKTPCANNLHCVRGICKLQGNDEAPSSQSSKTEKASPTNTLSPDECTWGCQGWDCDSETPCADDRQCLDGVCRAVVKSPQEQPIPSLLKPSTTAQTSSVATSRKTTAPYSTPTVSRIWGVTPTPTPTPTPNVGSTRHSFEMSWLVLLVLAFL
jgi:hypothetical protein